MIWLLVLGLALLCLMALVFVFKVPRETWAAGGAALFVGLAGYGFQGSPYLPGVWRESAEADSGAAGRTLIEVRSKISNRSIPPNNKWVVIADGLVRNGDYGDAAEILRGAIEADPQNSEAWLAMGNALLAHGEGELTAPTLYAYRRAVAADPKAPGPPFFLGLAYIQQGKLAEGREMWAGILASAPRNAPWKPMLAGQLARLDAVIAAASGQGGATAPKSPSRYP